MRDIAAHIHAFFDTLFKLLRGAVDRAYYLVKLYPLGLLSLVATLVTGWLSFISGSTVSIILTFISLGAFMLFGFVKWLKDHFGLAVSEASPNPTAILTKNYPHSLPQRWEISKDVNGRGAFSPEVNAILDASKNQLVLCKKWYKVPRVLEPYRAKILGTLTIKTFNGKKIRLAKDLTRKTIEDYESVLVQPTDYYSDRFTNHITSKVFRRSGKIAFDPRQLMVNMPERDGDEVGDLIPLTDSQLSNQLGGSTIAITRNHRLIFVRQASGSAENPGRLAPAGSGSFDYKDLKQYLCEDNQPTIQGLMRKGIERELSEECSAKVGPDDSKTILVGFSRLLYRGGKPEAFGLTLLRQESNELYVRPGEWGYINKDEIQIIPFGEDFRIESVLKGLKIILKKCGPDREDASLPLHLNTIFAIEFLETHQNEIISDFYLDQ